MEFKKIKKVTFAEGDFYKLDIDGVTQWKKMLSYVNLGDSVGEGYGASDTSKNYFSLLRDEMSWAIKAPVHGKNYAHGGDKIQDLIEMLSRADVSKSIKEADVITISIGGNDILSPCFTYLTGYIMGEYDLDFIGNACKAELDKLLSDYDEDPYTYKKMLDDLLEINNKATYVFTNQYHPYKYFHLEEGQNGFFKPILDLIPQMTLFWGVIEVDEFIKANFFKEDIIVGLFEKINSLSAWIDDLIITLNNNLALKLEEYKRKFNSSAKLHMTDTYSLFDTVPDRLGKGQVHFNDLVHVEFTRGYNWGDIHWGKLWDNRIIYEPVYNAAGDMVDVKPISKTPCNSVGEFWKTLIDYYIPENNFSGLVKTLLYNVAEVIIIPTVDLHPDDDGYYLIMRSFANKLSEVVPELSDLPKLNTVSYNGGGYTGEMKSQPSIDSVYGKKVYTHLSPHSFTPEEGYYLTNWTDQDGNSYSSEEEIYISSNLNLTAHWSNMYTVDFWKALNKQASLIYVSEQTGVQEIYGVDISYDGGNTFEQLDTSLYRGIFGADGTRKSFAGITLWAPRKISSPSFPYGTQIRVWVTYTLGDQKFGIDKYSETTAHIYKDGELISVADKPYYTLTLIKDTEIAFEWFLTGTVYFNATANWNCHIV